MLKRLNLTIYNTRTRQKEIFEPITPNKVSLYVCGPTVYGWAHIGNARPAVVFDVLVRILRGLYQKVTYVRNITDVDDKIIDESKKTGEPINLITLRTTRAYHEDIGALEVLPPDIEPRATEHIYNMIQMIADLIDRGHAYVSKGHVLFDVPSYSEYNQLSRRNQEELIAGSRVEIAPYKKNPSDFVLWKPSPPEIPGWESPWGRGRPGWHIECSAMSSKLLGQTIDIHGGGIELLFPHHENEEAQSRCAYGTPYLAKYWMHNGHITVKGVKMSKSLGNVFTVHELLKNHKGEALRYMLLMGHYRQPLDISEEVMQQCKQALDRFYGALRLCNLPETSNDEHPSTELQDLDEEVLNALLDDLNTPLAFARLHDLTGQIYKAPNQLIKNKLGLLLRESASLLGILQQDPEAWFQESTMGLSSSEIEERIKKREWARRRKDFGAADEIRQSLLDDGVVLEDTSEGTTWRRV